MFYRLLILVCIISCSLTAYSQDKKSVKYGKKISQSELKSHLTILSSDSLEGRETGEKGQKIAAKYIAEQFEKIGLDPIIETSQGKSFFQEYPLHKALWSEIYLKKDGEMKINLQDFLYYSAVETYGEEVIEVVFIEDPEMDLSKLSLAGKYVALSSGGWARWSDEKNPFNLAGVQGFFILSEREEQFDETLKRWSKRFAKPVVSTTITNEGPKVILIKNEMLEWMYEKERSLMETGEQTSLIINADRLVYNIGGENVLGYIPGNNLEETLIVTAHYDHLGKTDIEIYNGADDNGSGTASLLAVANAFMRATKKGIKPERGILFMALSGEEKGLLGSKYYVSNPVIPMGQTVANLNIDMVGRIDSFHEDNPDYLYLIGSNRLSTELHDLSEKVNDAFVGLELDYKYNDPKDPNRFYYRSDHYNFAKEGIPIIFYFNGTHVDYHRPTDTIDKINFDKMEKRAELIFYTAWDIVNRKERIKLD